jgi:hypothetical protein
MEDFKTYHKIKRLGDLENKDIFSDPTDTIVIQEKIDGANFRFLINSGKIVFGSRTQQLTSDEGEDTNIAKGFIRCVNYIRDRLKDKDLSKYNGLVFYGECCTMHTINYDFDNMPLFLGFDIYNIHAECYIEHHTVVAMYEELGLSMVPLVGYVLTPEIKTINDDMVPISKYARASAEDRQAEGIVFKNYSKQIFAKYVRDKFKECNSAMFGGNPKYNKVDDTQNAEITFKYCTNQRIEKVIFKLVDEGIKLEMKMMEHLPKRVYADIMEEEWKEICFSRWKVDFNQLKKAITTRCASVIKQVITNNAFK